MKKICFIISFSLLALVMYKIMGTYALLETQNTRAVETEVGKWVILVNGVDVTKELEFTIDTIKWNENENVKENKAAPGVSGYFDVTIDPTETDVSVKYEALFDFSVIENSSIVVTSISEINGKKIIKTSESSYAGVFSLNDIKKDETHTIRVHVQWQNNEENNEYDTELGMTPDSAIEIPITMHVSQYTGEEITEYIE